MAEARARLMESYDTRVVKAPVAGIDAAVLR